LARAGDAAGAQAIVGKLAKLSATDLWVNNYWLPSIRAAIELARMNPEQALKALEITKPYELGGDPITLDTLYPVYLRGEAYLMQKNASAAIAEFEKIPDHRGRAGNSILGALAYLQLGRAYALASETQKAKNAYQEFLTLWKNSDSDALRKQQAAAEYSALQ
jgi:tetratricopeptide (TPR) repeat protein